MNEPALKSKRMDAKKKEPEKWFNFHTTYKVENVAFFGRIELG